MSIRDLQTSALDINNKYNIYLQCVQNDDVILNITVYDKSLQADLSNYTCRLKAFKSDQIPLIQNTNIDVTGNVVKIECSKQLTTTAGVVKAELQFIEKSTLTKKSTFFIEIKVEKSALNIDGAVSTPVCTLLEEIDNKLDQIENIGQVLDEAKAVRDTLENDISTGNTTHSNIQNSIIDANSKKQEVETSISNASNKIADVETSIINANNSKTALDKSKNAADTSKNNLDEANTLAEHNIEELNKLGDVTNLAAKVEKNISDIANNTTNISNNTASINNLSSQMNNIENTRFKDVLSISKKIANSNKQIKVKIIGDSITAGSHGTGYNCDGETIFGDYKVNSSGVCWANKLKSYLEFNYNCSCKNYGVSGLTSAEMVNHLSDLVKSDDDIIICMIGTNDKFLSDGVTQLENNLKTIYNYINNLNKEIIFVSPIPATPSSESGVAHNSYEIENVYFKVCSSLNIEYISMFKDFIDYTESRNYELRTLLDTDGLHPVDKGYEVIYYLILKKLGMARLISTNLDKVLFNGSVYLNGTVITLADDIKNYKYLEFKINCNGIENKILAVDNINGSALKTINLTNNDTGTAFQLFEINLNLTDNKTLTISSNYLLLVNGTTVTKYSATSESVNSEFGKIISIMGRR